MKLPVKVFSGCVYSSAHMNPSEQSREIRIREMWEGNEIDSKAFD